MAQRDIPSSGESYWSVAQECALRRCKKKCKVKFDSNRCQRCRVYIRRYAPNTNESAIQMLMLQADTEAYKYKLDRRGHHFRYALAMVIFILLAIYGWNRHIELYNVPPYQFKTKTQIVVPHKPPTQTSTAYNTSAQSVKEKIEWTLEQVDYAMRRPIDVNGDGLINCIDAAVLFYQHYPDDKKYVGIILNYNPSTGFNHLFNVVWLNNTWIGIEPQAYYLEGWFTKSYFMRDFWPSSLYDFTINEDQTDKYTKYVRR